MEKVKAKSKNKIDMLHGTLLKKLLLFALPLAASSILQQLFNSVDVAVIGHFASSQAQAAVGCNGPVINLMLNLFVGISVGTNVVIANYIGRGEKDRISKAVHTSMIIAIISGIFLLILGLFLARPILTLMNTPSDILEQAVLYLQIYFLGMPFIMIYNFGSAILRSDGDTKRPLYCLIISGVVNATLNIFLVTVFHMGVSGVAIATVTSNIISASMIWYFLSREKGVIKMSYKKFKVTKNELVRILKIGVPAGVQGMVFSLANVFIQSTLNGYGSSAVAGSAVSLNYEYITYFIISAFSQAAVTFTSQNFGAGLYDRCKKVFRLSMILSMVITGCASLIIVIFSNFFVSLFTADSLVAQYAITRMLYILTLNFLASTFEIGGASLRGIGYSMTPAILTVFGTCIFRLLWIYIICPVYTSFEVLMAVYPISWVITGISVLIVYFIVRRKAFSAKPQL